MATKQPERQYAFGMVGLGVMGRNFLLDIGGASGQFPTLSRRPAGGSLLAAPGLLHLRAQQIMQCHHAQDGLTIRARERYQASRGFNQ